MGHDPFRPHSSRPVRVPVTVPAPDITSETPDAADGVLDGNPVLVSEEPPDTAADVAAWIAAELNDVRRLLRVRAAWEKELARPKGPRKTVADAVSPYLGR